MLPSVDAAPTALSDLDTPGAFEEVLGPLMLPAYRLAYGLLRDRSEAEDVVQEAAFRAWQHRRSFRPSAPLRPWFFAIVANQCRSSRRRQWWRVIRSSEPLPARGSEADTEATVDLRRALRKMGHEERLLIVLRYYLDLDYAEIALTLGVSEQAARSRLHRTVRRLRPQMTTSEERFK